MNLPPPPHPLDLLGDPPDLGDPLDLLGNRYLPLGMTPVHSVPGKVVPYIDGRGYFWGIAQALQGLASGDAVYIVNWFMDPWMHLLSEDPEHPVPDDKNCLGERLIKAAKVGVDVRILLWANRTLMPSSLTPFWDYSPVTPLNEPLTTYTKADIVEWNIGVAEEFRKLPEMQGRVMLDWSGARAHHAKYTVVRRGGELRAFIGGIDFVQSRWSEVGHPQGKSNWHDVGVELIGDAAIAALRDFAYQWEEVTRLSPAHYSRPGFLNYQLLNPPPLLPPPSNIPEPGPSPKGATAKTMVVRSYPEWREIVPWISDDASDPRNWVPWKNYPPDGLREILAGIVKALETARKYVYIEDQGPTWHYLGGLGLTHDLVYPHVTAAAKRGVKVIIVTGGASDPKDPPQDLSKLNDVADIVEELNEAGKGDNFRLYTVRWVLVHSKLILVDDEFFSIGSANFWDQSMDGTDVEINAMGVVTDDLVRRLRADLWIEHLGINRSPNPEEYAAVLDIDRALGIWEPTWATGAPLPFSRPWPLLYRAA